MTDREVQKIAVALADELERRGMVAAAGRSAQTRKEPRTCAGEIHESLDHIATETDGGSSSSREAAALLAKLRAKPKRSASSANSTLALSAGASSHVVAASLGHENPAVTLRHYAQRGTAEAQRSAQAQARLADVIPLRAHSAQG